MRLTLRKRPALAAAVLAIVLLAVAACAPAPGPESVLGEQARKEQTEKECLNLPPQASDKARAQNPNVCTPTPTPTSTPTAGAPAGEQSPPIGASGGTFRASDGATIQVPSGAVSGATTFTYAPATSPPPPPAGAQLHRPFELTARAGGAPVTQFGSPVTITVPVDPAVVTGRVRLAYFDAGRGAWVELPSAFDGAPARVAAATTHLTLFAVVYDPNPQTPSQTLACTVGGTTATCAWPSTPGDFDQVTVGLSETLKGATRVAFSGWATAHAHAGRSSTIALDLYDPDIGAWKTVYTTTLTSPATVEHETQFNKTKSLSWAESHLAEVSFPAQSVSQVRLRSSPSMNQTFHMWGGASWTFDVGASPPADTPTSTPTGTPTQTPTAIPAPPTATPTMVRYLSEIHFPDGLPQTISTTRRVTGQATYGHGFSATDYVCLTTYWVDDGIGQGEQYSYGYVDGPYGAGWINNNPETAFSNQSCFRTGIHDTSVWDDGTNAVELWMATGTARLGLAWMEITGYPTAQGFGVAASGAQGDRVYLDAGQSGSATVTVTGIGDVPVADVALTARTAARDVALSFSQASGQPTFSSTLSIQTSPTTPGGFHPILITATGGGITRSTLFYIQLTGAPATATPTATATSTPAPTGTATPTDSYVSATVTTGGQPYGPSVNEVTNRIYVPNYAGKSVSVIDGATDAVVATVPVPSTGFWLGVNPTTNRVYVPSPDTNSVVVIDGATNSVVATITGYPLDRPYDVAVDPVANRVYVSNSGRGEIAVVDGATNAVTAWINPSDTNFAKLAVNPATRRLYWVRYGVGYMRVFDTNTNAAVAQVPMPSGTAWNVALNEATNRVYATNTDANALTVLDGATNAVVATIPIPNRPTELYVEPVANRVYVRTDAGLVIVDGATEAVVGSVTVPGDNWGIAVNGSTRTAYVTQVFAGNVVVIRNLD